MKSSLKAEMLELVCQDLRGMGVAFIMLSIGSSMFGTIEPSAFAFGLVIGFVMVVLGYIIKAVSYLVSEDD